MEDSVTKNRRIAKNTLLLYIRTFLVMIVSLYTSRVTLQALGIDNYGIYNVIGGLVAMFTVVSGPMSSAISRFLTYGLGKGDLKHLQTVFSTSVIVLLILGAIVILIGETIGLWFLNFKLNIPSESIYAANWVLQCSLATMVLQLINIPYSAAIISHEKMGVYAYMSILEIGLKLILVLLLLNVTRYVLIIYAFGVLTIYAINRLIYGIYCSKKFQECRFIKAFDKKIFKEVSSFATWSFWGNTASLFNTQGVGMLMNMFGGVVVNAAKGLTGQVESAVMSFVNSFTTAFTPQIIKSYAEENKSYMFSLMERGTKFSFFLMLMFLIPLEFEANVVLSLWLERVPEYTVSFLRLSLVCTAIMLIGQPYLQGLLATGNIRNYQIWVSIIGSSVFLFTWLFYRIGYPIISFYWVNMTVYFLLIWLRMWFVQKQLGYKISQFSGNVFFPIVKASILSLVIPALISILMKDGLLRLIILTSISILSTSFVVFMVGLNGSERIFIREYIKNKLAVIFSK